MSNFITIRFENWNNRAILSPLSTLAPISTLSQKSATVAENGETTATKSATVASVDRLLGQRRPDKNKKWRTTRLVAIWDQFLVI